MLNRMVFYRHERPNSRPRRQTVYTYFRTWKSDGTLKRVHDALRAEVRRADGRNPEPGAAVIDSRSEQTTESGDRGYDAGKNVNGRKRQVIVDTRGLTLEAAVHPANVQDLDGAKLVVEKLVGQFPRLGLIWADGEIAGKLAEWVKEATGCALEIVKRPKGERGFKILAKRRAVERTLARLGRYRRMSKDYERLAETSDAWIRLAMIRLTLRRLATRTELSNTLLEKQGLTSHASRTGRPRRAGL